MEKITAVILALALSLFAYAQDNIIVTGIVTNDEGEPVMGVSIIAQDLEGSAITAEDGSFSITLFSGFETLILKGRGIATRKYYLTGASEVNISVEKQKES